MRDSENGMLSDARGYPLPPKPEREVTADDVMHADTEIACADAADSIGEIIYEIDMMLLMRRESRHGEYNAEQRAKLAKCEDYYAAMLKNRVDRFKAVEIESAKRRLA